VSAGAIERVIAVVQPHEFYTRREIAALLGRPKSTRLIATIEAAVDMHYLRRHRVLHDGQLTYIYFTPGAWRELFPSADV
jgi:alkylated DNA nucleotide flippase Atl1